MEGRCETCRWWNREPDEGIGLWPEALAERAGMSGWRICAFHMTDDVGGPESRNRASKAFAYTNDYYAGAELYAAPDFGCVQWEEA